MTSDIITAAQSTDQQIHANREAVAEGLAQLLADTYTLYLKTHNYHWNVTGPTFASLHLLFESQYRDLAVAVDVIAERIRALDFPAPASYREFARRTTIPDDDDLPHSTEMIRRLLAGHDVVIRTATSMSPLVDEARDEPTADLLNERRQAHEKSTWMLRSLLA